MTEEGDVTLGSELERRAQQKQQRQQDDDDAIAQGEGANTSAAPPTSGDNYVDQSLSDNLKSKLTIDDSDDENQNNDSQILATNNNSRKAQKAAQKKSKKAKRREKEEHAERGERIAAEKTRQRERAERLGIIEGDGAVSTIALSNENNIMQQGGDGAVQGTDVKPCNTCGGAFTPGEYRVHFRSDWHRYNVKLKMKNVPPVSEQEFLICDSDAFFEL
jgi:ribosome maturation protein SDO1